MTKFGTEICTAFSFTHSKNSKILVWAIIPQFLRRFYPPTCLQLTENILNREFTSSEPNQKWESDIAI